MNPQESLSNQGPETKPAKGIAAVCYGLQALSFFLFFPSLIAVIIGYQKRKSEKGTWLGTHFEWQIKSFWVLVSGSILCILLRVLGIVFIALLSLWFLYRIVKGWLALYEGRAVDNSGFF